VSRFVIYGLVDPRDGQLRYVGKSTTGLKQRLASHLCASSLRDRTLKNGWLKRLLTLGLRPEAFVLESCDNKTALNEAEQHHLATMRYVGCDLTNMTSGGDGLGVPCSLERRRKISEAQRGKPRAPWTEERRQVDAERRRSNPTRRSAEAIEKTASALRGKPRPDYVKAAMSEAATKFWASTEQRRAQSRRRGMRPFVSSTGQRFETVSEAATALGLNRIKIGLVLRGKRKTTGGISFAFAT